MDPMLHKPRTCWPTRIVLSAAVTFSAIRLYAMLSPGVPHDTVTRVSVVLTVATLVVAVAGIFVVEYVGVP